jgi:hypothetical protein
MPLRVQLPLPDPGLQAIAESVAQAGILAAQKAAANLLDPTAYPIAPGPSLEASFLTHLQAQPAPVRQKITTNVARLLAAPSPIGLHAAEPVAPRLRAVAPLAGVKIDFGAIAAQRQARMAVPPADPVPPTGLRQQDIVNEIALTINNVHCDQVTGLIGLESDHITISGIGIDDQGNVGNLRTCDLGSFNNGDDDFSTPNPYAVFFVDPVGNWPKTYTAMIVLTETYSGGGLQDFMNALAAVAKQDLQDAAEDVGAAIGAWIGGPIGAIAGYAIGEVLSLVVGWVFDKVWNWLKQELFGDDIFSPASVQYHAIPGSLSTAQLSFDDSAHGGEYTVYYGWNTRWGTPGVNECLHSYWDIEGWHAWDDLGGTFNYELAIAWLESNELRVVGTNVFDTLSQRVRTTAGWSDWRGIGAPPGGVTSGPAITAQGGARLDLVVRGADNAIWHASFGGGAWSGWDSLGGVATASPGICSWMAGRLDVFCVGQDGTIYHNWYTGSWSGWFSIGAPLDQPVTSGPSAASRGANVLDLVVRGADGQIWHKGWGATGWTAWQAIGLAGASYGPGIAAVGETLSVFGVDMHGHMWTSDFGANGWGPWGPVFGTAAFTSRPAAVLEGKSIVDLIGRGTQGGA